ncbi:MAG: molecular chaperone HtpG [Alphaproteobacteria bacterium]|nr:molecular chaperone HtpG [Alphaproteobacteria bacterium]
MTTHTHNFDTDVSRLLDIVANALYTNQDVFLRELISNAADACDRLRYEQVLNPALATGKSARIHISKNTAARTLMIRDNGIGMSEPELRENLGTIARSGTAKIMEQVKDKSSLNLIGQFGVGFYASFMVASRVEVISRKAGENNVFYWESDGKTGYNIRPASQIESDLLLEAAGTAIILHIKDSASEFLIDDKIKQVVLNWSDHIDVPVYLELEDLPVNAGSALWTRPRDTITPAQYSDFYHHIGHVFDEPVMTAHWTAEGTMEYTALLFIPSMRPWDLYDPGRKHAVRLYVKRVYITENVENLVYPWLRFMRGIIDSQDLPLNISREMLQRSAIVEKIRRSVTKKILSELSALSQKDPAAFDTFWHQFGAVIKEGLYDAVEHRDDIFKICRFFSSYQDSLTSLEEYLSRMKPSQEDIYYMTGEKRESLKHSPQLEGFTSRGLEVLFLTDTIDPFWLQMVSAYQGKKFVSITKGDINLDRFSSSKGEAAPVNTPPENHDHIEKLILFLSQELSGDVGSVRISKRLTDSPVCLVADEKGVDMHMERVLKIQQKYDPQAKRVLEINKNHPLIQKLAFLSTLDPKPGSLTDGARLLLDQALIIQGEPVNDPSSFVKRLTRLMESSLAA